METNCKPLKFRQISYRTDENFLGGVGLGGGLLDFENDSHYHSIKSATVLRMVLIIVIPYPLSY